MNREEFKIALRNHDWFYAYSDDSRAYIRGEKYRENLNDIHEKLNCPFDFCKLRKYSNKMFVSEFVKTEDGYVRPEFINNKNIDRVKLEDLLTNEEVKEIDDWFGV